MGAPEISGGMKILAYLLSFFLLTPILGIIFYVLWHNKPHPEDKKVAKNCLILGIVGLIFWIIIFPILLMGSLCMMGL